MNQNLSAIDEQNTSLIDLKSPNNSSSSSSGMEEEDNVFRNVMTITFYALIVCVSLCGNLLVCKVAFGKRKMRNTTNMLIASLACSDIVMTAFNIPFNVARLLLLDWPFGSVLCFLVPFIQISCVYVSTLTMTVIAIHRWCSLTRKFTSFMHTFSCARISCLVIVIWLMAATLSLPHSVYNELKQVNYTGRVLTRCRVTYPRVEFDFRQFLTLEVFLTQYLLPLLITCTVYVKIGFIVSKQGKLLEYTDNDRRRHHAEAKRRRIIMLALVVCVFAICWLPLNVYYILVDFKLIHNNFYLFITCHWFAMSSVCYNPFIYCWLNESFRKGAQRLYRFITKCGRESKFSDTIQFRDANIKHESNHFKKTVSTTLV